jgi:hypothetical protein
MDKPYNKNSSKPQMPYEILQGMKEEVILDSLNIINGRLKYAERYPGKTTPAEITFNKININADGINTNSILTDSIVVFGEGLFMNSGKMKVTLRIPMTSNDFSFRYSGSLGTMEITELNTFIEPAENHRIKSGVIHKADYNIDVHAGKASGELRIEYQDFSIAVIDNNSGKESGIVDRFSTFIGEKFILRGTNMPGTTGLMKTGKIKYTRDPDDTFMQFLWFALRSGLSDVVGF